MSYSAESTARNRYGLVGAVTPLLQCWPDMTMLFACGNAYYLCNEISDDICRIEQPADLAGILAALAKPLDSAGLRMQWLDELPEDEQCRRCYHDYGLAPSSRMSNYLAEI
jgi:hypothetical protein